MYRIKNAETGEIIDDIVAPKWVKQQQFVDFPILCDSLDDADGVVLGDDETMAGFVDKAMTNYEPLVVVEEVSAEPQLFQRIEKLEADLATAKEENKQLQEMSQSALAELLLIQAQGMKGGV